MKGLFRRKGSQGASHLHDSSPSTRSSLLEPSTVGGEPSTDVDGESPSLITSNIDTEILPNSVDTYHAITEWLEHGSTPVPDISEATPDLVPLKSASSSLICAIEILMVPMNPMAAYLTIAFRMFTMTTLPGMKCATIYILMRSKFRATLRD